jgi:hypothetical protein
MTRRSAPILSASLQRMSHRTGTSSFHSLIGFKNRFSGL